MLRNGLLDHWFKVLNKVEEFRNCRAEAVLKGAGKIRNNGQGGGGRCNEGRVGREDNGENDSGTWLVRKNTML